VRSQGADRIPDMTTAWMHDTMDGGDTSPRKGEVDRAGCWRSRAASGTAAEEAE